jgi:hypothetical protein
VLLAFAMLAMTSAPLPAQQSASGLGSIAGSTVDAGGRPVPRAVVTLSGSTMTPDLRMVSGDQGQFVFGDLPPGRFVLSASKPTYLPASLGSFSDSSRPAIEVASSQQVAGLQLVLPRGAVITGRVTDAFGRPLTHAPIVVMEYRTVNGARTLWSFGQQLPPTNSRGQYRIAGLAPGSYLVSAYEPGDYLWFPGASVGPVPSGSGGISGADIRTTTAAEIQWALGQLDATRRGGAAGSLPPPPPTPGPAVTTGMVYYPGTLDPSRAVAVTVRAGDEIGGIDFAMQHQRTARITGRVLGTDGRPAANARLTIKSAGSTSSRPLPDGSFVLAGVGPGEMTLLATLGTAVSATRTIVVDGQDITDLVLTLQAAP